MSDHEENFNEVGTIRLIHKDERAVLYIHDDLRSVGEWSYLLEQLRETAEKYEVIEVWISSAGGDGRLMIEIIEALEQFSTIVTICLSVMASAAAIIWCCGDIRVVGSHTFIMFHRESYEMQGTTPKHIELAQVYNEIYGNLLREYATGVLTPEELDKVELVDTYVKASSLIERSVAIHIDDYMERLNGIKTNFSVVGQLVIDNETGCRYIVGDGNFQPVRIEPLDISFSSFEYCVADEVTANKTDGNQFRIATEQLKEVIKDFNDRDDNFDSTEGSIDA